ncbi:MAG: NTP transferase domain-containing protein [Rikenellaceae bacterium]|nr:NTP transferase domain-containing protein [Rikenellaceae bacterium]
MNAIILAAGKSNRFAPFTYERPKGLFRVKGEILIERQIEQLTEAGIQDIYIVVGYMKEKFFYLEQKYGVKLIVNNEFGKKGNLYSLYVAREHLSDTFICCADHYFINNPFLYENVDNCSYRACAYQTGKFRGFSVEYSDAHVITSIKIDGADSLAMVGHAYMNERCSSVFRGLMEKEINDFGVSSMFWEEFYAKHIGQITLYMKNFKPGDILEFNSIEDLREFDSEFLMNVDSDIITNICSTLHCVPNDVINIAVINAGLTNVSFSFECCGSKYVYRHPGGTAGNLIDRQAELFMQMTAKKNGIDKSVITMDLSGWKLSYYVHNAKNCDFEKYDEQLKIGMKYLHMLHAVKPDDTIKVFDDVSEGKRLMAIASATKGNLAHEFADLIEKVDRLYPLVKADATRLGYDLVPCHNDTYEPNYLYDDSGEIYLIDWEYAGLNYAANDIACILCRYDWTDEQIERYLRFYVGRELTKDEHRYYMAFIPISAFYWFCWGLYKGSVGDDDSFFFLPAYRNLVRFIDTALESYEASE